MILDEKQIEQAFRPLVGLPLSDMGRFSGWQRLEFGPQKPFVNAKGQDIMKADYAIHVACGWRIIGPEGIVVGSDNYAPGSERHDEQGEPFFKMLAETPPVVQSVQTDVVGSVHFAMTRGYSLDILPMAASQEALWIFLTPDKGTFTLDAQGFGS